MPNKNFSATITIGGAIGSSFRTAIGGVAGGIKEIGKAVKDLKSTAAKADAFNPGAVLKAGRAYQEAKRNATALAAEVRFLGENATKKQRQEAERARVASLRLQKAWELKRQEAHKVRDELRKLGVDTRKIADEKKRLADRADLLSKRLGYLSRIANSDVGGAFRNMVSTIARAGAVVGGVVGGIGAAVFGVAKSTSDAGDKIAKTAAYLGITTDALQEFRYAGELSGVAAEDMDAALEKLTIRVGDTVDPSSDLGRAIRRVGLSVQELRALGTEEAMYRIADGLQAIEDPTIRAQTVVQLFGKSAINMVGVLKDGSAELMKMRKEAHETGNVLGKEALDDSEKFNDAFYRVKQSVLGVKNSLGAALMPVVIDLMDEFRLFVRENAADITAWAKDFAKELRVAIPAIVSFGREFIGAVKPVVQWIGAAVQAMGGWKVVAAAVGVYLGGSVLLSVVKFGTAVYGLGSAVVGLVATLGTVGFTITGVGALIVAAAGLVWYYWEPIKGFFVELGQTISYTFDLLKQFSGFNYFKDKIGSAFGGGDTVAPAAAIAGSSLTNNIRGPGAGSRTIVQQSIPINVNTQPGQSNTDIAEEVAHKLKERQASLARAVLHDN